MTCNNKKNIIVYLKVYQAEMVLSKQNCIWLY